MTIKSDKPINEILKGLNEEQKSAVTHKTGPLLIVAGAGTGKTTVIVNRIAYLISSKVARPEEILALTFTEKAASEMQERVDMLVPYGFADVWISTFHSFGNRVRTSSFSGSPRISPRTSADFLRSFFVPYILRPFWIFEAYRRYSNSFFLKMRMFLPVLTNM